MFKFYKSYKIYKKIPYVFSETLRKLQNIKTIRKNTSAKYLYDILIERINYSIDFDIYNEDKRMLYNKLNKIIKNNNYKDKCIEIPIPKNILDMELFELYWSNSSLKYNVSKPYYVNLSFDKLIYVYLDSLNSHNTTSNMLVRRYILENNLSIELDDNSFNSISNYFDSFIKYEINNNEINKVLHQIKTIEDYLYKVKYIYKNDVRKLIFDSLTNPEYKEYIVDLIQIMDSLKPNLSKLFQIQLVKELIQSSISEYTLNISVNQVFFKGFDNLKNIDLIYLEKVLTSEDAKSYLKECMNLYNELIYKLIDIDYFKYKNTIDKYFIKYDKFKMTLNN